VDPNVWRFDPAEGEEGRSFQFSPIAFTVGAVPADVWAQYSFGELSDIYGHAERKAVRCLPRQGSGNGIPCETCRVARLVALSAGRELADRWASVMIETETGAETETATETEAERAAAQLAEVSAQLAAVTAERDVKALEVERLVRERQTIEAKSVSFGCSVRTAAVLLNICDEEARNMATGNFDSSYFEDDLRQKLQELGYGTRTYAVEMSHAATFTVFVEASCEDEAETEARERFSNAGRYEIEDWLVSNGSVSVDSVEVDD